MKDFQVFLLIRTNFILGWNAEQTKIVHIHLLIQFPYNITNSHRSSSPKLVYAICHDYGPIYNLKWCPAEYHDLQKVSILKTGFIITRLIL